MLVSFYTNLVKGQIIWLLKNQVLHSFADGGSISYHTNDFWMHSKINFLGRGLQSPYNAIDCRNEAATSSLEIT
jgi:hypothetical protein